jgi:endonuclease-3
MAIEVRSTGDSMNKRNIDFITATLDKMFPMPAIPLRHRDPYTLLISVILSAQSTDVCVNSITPKLFALADAPEKMVRLTQKQIYDIVRPCGLAPQKSRAILALSRLLLERHGGRVPDTFEELENLPGVGHKTASVVMAQAFGKEAFPVDTHIHRLAKRWGLSDGSTVKKTEEDLKRIFPKGQWHKLHLQIIYFGRQFCPARGHDPEKCPICAHLNKGR